MDEPRLASPWLAAAWPGMGAVGTMAATHLARVLGARHVAELPPGEHFDLQSVRVEKGLLQPNRVPRSLLYAWRDPRGHRDLLVFLAEAQPQVRGYALCEELIQAVRERGVSRVVTFAALASPMQRGDGARVFAVASGAPLLEELRSHGVEPLQEGEVGGLNGVLLAAAAAEGIEAACLLGEMPYTATGAPNPRAAASVVRAFARLSGLRIDVTELDEAAAGEEEGPTFGGDEEEGPTFAPVGAEEEEEAVAPEVLARIEALFAEAGADRDKALELKAFLDRHGLFRDYEDRFLDLFRRGV